MPEKIIHKGRCGRRAKLNGLVPLTVSVEPELKRAIVEISVKEGRSISNIVRELLMNYVSARSGSLIIRTREGGGEGGGVNGP